MLCWFETPQFQLNCFSISGAYQPRMVHSGHKSWRSYSQQPPPGEVYLFIVNWSSLSLCVSIAIVTSDRLLKCCFLHDSLQFLPYVGSFGIYICVLSRSSLSEVCSIPKVMSGYFVIVLAVPGRSQCTEIQWRQMLSGGWLWPDFYLRFIHTPSYPLIAVSIYVSGIPLMDFVSCVSEMTILCEPARNMGGDSK
jgi:hypothetical protein